MSQAPGTKTSSPLLCRHGYAHVTAGMPWALGAHTTKAGIHERSGRQPWEAKLGSLEKPSDSSLIPHSLLLPAVKDHLHRRFTGTGLKENLPLRVYKGVPAPQKARQAGHQSASIPGYTVRASFERKRKGRVPVASL